MWRQRPRLGAKGWARRHVPAVRTDSDFNVETHGLTCFLFNLIVTLFQISRIDGFTEMFTLKRTRPRDRPSGEQPYVQKLRVEVIDRSAIRFIVPRVSGGPPRTNPILGDSLAVELSALTRAALVRIQVPQPRMVFLYISMSYRASAGTAGASF